MKLLRLIYYGVPLSVILGVGFLVGVIADCADLAENKMKAAACWLKDRLNL